MVQIPSAIANRTLEKKREILEAASRVFRRRGLHATGMREIAAELGMHVGNLYYYFDNKQELLAFCQEDTLGGLLALAERVQETDGRPDRSLHRLIVGHLVRLNQETPGSLAHLEVEALEPPWREPILAQRERYEAAVRRLIEQGIEQGIFRPTDAKVAAMTILGALNWTVKWFRPEGGKSATEIGELFAEYLVRGLLASGDEPTIPDPPTPQQAPEPAGGGGAGASE